MAVISTYISNDVGNNVSSIIAYNYPFSKITQVEVPQSVHQKESILHVQVYDENNEMIYPNIRNENLKVIVEFSIEFSGTIKII